METLTYEEIAKQRFADADCVGLTFAHDVGGPGATAVFQGERIIVVGADQGVVTLTPGSAIECVDGKVRPQGGHAGLVRLALARLGLPQKLLRQHDQPAVYYDAEKLRMHAIVLGEHADEPEDMLPQAVRARLGFGMQHNVTGGDAVILVMEGGDGATDEIYEVIVRPYVNEAHVAGWLLETVPLLLKKGAEAPAEAAP